MSNKVLKDANNQLINIDGSNLSSFSEDVVHKGTQLSPSNELIYGTKTFAAYMDGESLVAPTIRFDASYGSITNSTGYVYLDGSFARASIGYGIDATAAITSAQSNEIHMRAPGETVPSDYWESGISFNTTDTKYNDSTSDYEFRKGYSKLPTGDGSTSNNYYTIATQEWSNSNKVSKTGDTMTGGLVLNSGSGYTSSPSLVFVNHSGNGYLYKNSDNLILNQAGTNSYTLTFPAKTGTLALTSDIKRSRMYKYQISPTQEYYDSNSVLVVYTNKDLNTTELLSSFQNSIQALFNFLNGTNVSSYGNRIGPAYVQTTNNGDIPILYVERTSYSGSATIKPYACFGGSIGADEYTTNKIGNVSKAAIDFDEVPF